MPELDKKALNARDLCTQFITPTIPAAKWDVLNQVPPLVEQRRIVAKVEELLALCDELEARQTAARTTATHFLDASLRQLLAS